MLYWCKPSGDNFQNPKTQYNRVWYTPSPTAPIYTFVKKTPHTHTRNVSASAYPNPTYLGMSKAITSQNDNQKKSIETHPQTATPQTKQKNTRTYTRLHEVIHDDDVFPERIPVLDRDSPSFSVSNLSTNETTGNIQQ